MLIIARKYIKASTETKKTLILTKKPIIGGSPEIDNKTILKNNAKILLDLFNKFKSAKSLFCFFMYLYFNRNNKRIDHIDNPAIIYKKKITK